ncbi:MAG: hypothetical protein AUJ98_04865 [Bacteroidetes bacterium CG2_30_33_31]|nr:MAG: hypothetical protein AUJ98_04865 [Bacteroidetes bacterium CG2_30_33_31]
MNKLYLIIIASMLITACSNSEPTSDAYGNFEVDNTTISAESQGKLLSFNLEEGDFLKAGQHLGQIDTLDLYFKKQQLQAQMSALKSNFANIDAQSAVSQQQKTNLKINQNRIQQLFNSKAATQQQLDDMNGNVQVVQKQIEAINTQKLSLQNQIKVIENQINEINYAISKSTIINPTEGVVLTKLSMVNEIVAMGKPLYSIADLRNIKLKVYVSENQLAKVKIGKEAKVLIDTEKGKMKELKGRIIWVSSTAEFTPKTIETREERVNLVYAVKILVVNDGSLKVGMPGEAIF